MVDIFVAPFRSQMSEGFLERVSDLVSGLPVYQAAGGGIFSPNPGLVVWTWLVFFLLLLVLYRFAWKPILKSLDDRENKIRKSIEEAERIEKEVEDIAKRNEEALSHAKLEGQRIIDESRHQAERLKENIKKHAEREAHEVLEKAKLTIDEARSEAVSSIKKEAIHLSIEIASKLIGENLNNEKNRKLANGFLKKMK